MASTSITVTLKNRSLRNTVITRCLYIIAVWVQSLSRLVLQHSHARKVTYSTWIAKDGSYLPLQHLLIYTPFPVALILFSIIIIIIIPIIPIITASPPRSHVSTEQSRKETCDIRGSDQDLRGQQQQQEREDEMRDKAHTEVTDSMEPAVSAPKPHQAPTIIRPKANRSAPQPATILLTVVSSLQYLVEAFTQVLSMFLEPSHSGRLPAALGKLCRWASLWALLRLPAAAAAYEFEKYDVAAGYGTIPTTFFLMAAVFIWRVQDSVQRHRRGLRDSVRGRLEKGSYTVWVIAVLLVMPITLAPAINVVNQLTAVDPITEL